jgi:hypothetical protein
MHAHIYYYPLRFYKKQRVLLHTSLQNFKQNIPEKKKYIVLYKIFASINFRLVASLPLVSYKI